MSNSAPKYDWTCSACDAANPAGGDHCQACGCPATTNRALVDEWRTHGRIRPRKPSLAPDPATTFFLGPLLGKSSPLTDAVAHCQGCGLMMYIRDTECPHCSYVHSEPEKVCQRHYAADYTGRGLRHGAKYWLVFFVVVPVIFFLYINT